MYMYCMVVCVLQFSRESCVPLYDNDAYLSCDVICLFEINVLWK